MFFLFGSLSGAQMRLSRRASIEDLVFVLESLTTDQHVAKENNPLQPYRQMPGFTYAPLTSIRLCWLVSVTLASAVIAAGCLDGSVLFLNTCTREEHRWKCGGTVLNLAV